MQQGKRPQSTHPLYQSKYHCYIEIFSLGVWKTLDVFMFYWIQQGGSPSSSSFFLSIGGPANLCDSVATECLPAAECSALQQPSPPPNPPTPHSPTTPRSLPPCGSLQTGFPLLSPPPHWPPGQEQLFRTGPPVLNLLLLLRQSLSSATSDSTLSLSLSCKDHFSQRWRRLMCFFFFSLMELPVCIFI